MSFSATLNQRAHIYARQPGQEHWKRVTVAPIRCRITALSPRPHEETWARLHPEATHQARCLPSPHLQPGNKLTVLAAGAAHEEQLQSHQDYLILAVQSVPHPRPRGHVVVALQRLGETQ